MKKQTVRMIAIVIVVAMVVTGISAAVAFL